jgi:hypothetical protein
MSIGNDERRLSYTGGKCNGRVATKGDLLKEIAFEETGEGGRSIEYTEDGKGGFRLQITHPDGDLILLLQTPKGAFRTVALVGGETFAGQAESFAAFYKQHRKVMEGDILPVLSRFGIQPVLSAAEPKVRKTVTALLQRTPDSIDEGKKLLGELDSEQFAVREQATKTLADRFAIYQDLIREKQKDKDASLEVRTRVEKILTANADLDRVNQSIELLNLTKDPAYVVSLLDGATPAESTRLGSHLEKLTGQKLGSDAKAWKEWLEKNAKK